jgi:hypothetical protein
MLLDATAIKMPAEPGVGMYESFYFRGTGADGMQAFWLKHGMLRYRDSGEVWLEAALVLYDRADHRTRAVYSREALDPERFSRMSSQARDWEHVALEVSNGSSVEIGHGHVAGRLVGEGGKARWDLQLRRSGMKLYPFPHAAMYSLPWPGTKLLTRDCHMDFHGSLRAGDLAFTGTFHGMNGHNWGSAHAHTYAYANCAQFRGRDTHAYFDGFSARVGIARGLVATPYLSMASLHTGRHWHHFNRLVDAPRQKVRRLDDHGWRAELSNGTHRLEIDIDGVSPAALPWAVLHYQQPNRKRAVVKNTKFAALKLRLCRANGEVEDELFSDACELETLLPGNVPRTEGYIGQA